jgi:hypothetical protein
MLQRVTLSPPARCLKRLGCLMKDCFRWAIASGGERVTGQGYSVVYSKETYVLHPARHTLHTLLSKVRLQARYKSLLKPWKWKDLFRQVLPMGWRFYWSLVGDRNLPTVEAKFRFLRVVCAIKYVVAWKMLKYFYSSIPRTGSWVFSICDRLLAQAQ